jgi:hypothetical protein
LLFALLSANDQNDNQTRFCHILMPKVLGTSKVQNPKNMSIISLRRQAHWSNALSGFRTYINRLYKANRHSVAHLNPSICMSQFYNSAHAFLCRFNKLSILLVMQRWAVFRFI